MPKLKPSTFDPSDKSYLQFLETTKNQIRLTRIKAAKAIYQQQISLYSWIGQHIVSVQEQYGWGKSVVERLSKDLKQSFGSTFGFSVQNLWYMRQFYLEYKNYPNLQRFVGEIPWGQNLVIMAKVKDFKAREYYLQATHQMGWTRDVLSMQISSQAYERHLLANKQHSFDQALPEHLAEQADYAMKDIYMLDMLGITKPVIEKEIENRMVHKIKEVMLEFGYGFTFIGNQYRLVAPSGTESFIDILFFNRRLRCLVAIELKAGKFKPEYAGKMNYYLNLLDDLVKEDWENPSIGIILCTERNRIDVEYALRGIDKPVGVSEFKLSRELPSDLADKLPDPAKLEAELLKEMGVEEES